MGITYNPAEAKKTYNPGEYNASLNKSTVKTTKDKGWQMVELEWRLFPSDGHPPIMQRDWIILEGEFNSLWKLEKLALAWGKLDDYKAGHFDPADHIGESIVAVVRIRADKKNGGEQNAITNYKPMQEAPLQSGFTVSAALQAQMKRAETEVPEPVFAPDSTHDDCPF